MLVNALIHVLLFVLLLLLGLHLGQNGQVGVVEVDFELLDVRELDADDGLAALVVGVLGIDRVIVLLEVLVHVLKDELLFAVLDSGHDVLLAVGDFHLANLEGLSFNFGGLEMFPLVVLDIVLNGHCLLAVFIGVGVARLLDVPDRGGQDLQVQLLGELLKFIFYLLIH